MSDVRVSHSAGRSAIRLATIGALLAGTVMTAPAFAQNADAEVAVGEIVVTAQKRSENVQKVPKQVEVLGASELAAAGVTKLIELQAVSPTLTGSDQSQNSRAPGVRGIVSVANSIGVQSQTGVIVDDIPLPTYSTLANELSDVERVEIFAGPQATLTGRNSAAGIINIVTRKPKFETAFDVTAEQTTDRQTRVSANLNIPVSKTVALAVSGVLNHWAGPYRNSLSEGRFGGWKTHGARAKLLWQPNDRFTATLSGHYIETDGTAPPFLVGGPYVQASSTAAYVTLDPKKTPLSAYGYTIDKDNRTFTANQTATYSTRDKGGALRLDLDVGSLGTLSSLTSYSESSQPRADLFFSFPDATGNYFAYTNVRTKYTTQELRLVSPSSGALTYTIGAIYSHADLYQPYIRRGIFPVNWLRSSDQKSYAVFARGTYELSPSDFITAGLRYQHDRQGYDWTFRSVATDAVTAHSSGSSPYDFGGGEISYRHEFRPDLSVYVTYSRAETGQAYDLENNALASTSTLKPLDSEKVRNYEAGLKGRFFDRKLTVNLSGFWADYDNYQVQSINSNDTTQAPIIRLLAVGKVRTRGFEGQFNLKATDALSLGLAGAYTESIIRDYPNAACYLLQSAAAGCVGGNQANLAGLTLPNAPKWKLNANADYRRAINDRVDFLAGVQWRYQSSVRYDMLGDPNTTQKAYSVTNLRLGVASGDDAEHKWSVEVFGNNIFDKNYYSYIFNRSNRFTYPTGSGTVLSARYDRASFRYFGLRGTFGF